MKTVIEQRYCRNCGPIGGDVVSGRCGNCGHQLISPRFEKQPEWWRCAWGADVVLHIRGLQIAVVDQHVLACPRCGLLVLQTCFHDGDDVASVKMLPADALALSESSLQQARDDVDDWEQNCKMLRLTMETTDLDVVTDLPPQPPPWPQS